MALKREDNGTYTIRTQAEAEEAIGLRQELKADIQDAEQDATEISKALLRFLQDSELDELEVPGFRAKIIQRNYPKWNGLKLRRLLKKRFAADEWQGWWRSLTTRIPDQEKINEAVAAGEIEMEDIEAAYEDNPGQPFLEVRKVSD